MASDIMSCLFLNYNKKTVMTLAIPVAVKFLHKGNKVSDHFDRTVTPKNRTRGLQNGNVLFKKAQSKQFQHLNTVA